MMLTVRLVAPVWLASSAVRSAAKGGRTPYASDWVDGLNGSTD